ncbi:transcriptional regulator, partial [Escherichia coli]
EHLFILAFGHPPQTRLTVTDDMTPRLQRVLDAFTIPAIIRTASWDVIAWNAPAARVLTDYSQLPLAERNVLRRLFTRPEARCTLEDWQRVGQLIVNAFRADVTRMGATKETDQLIAELSQQSVEFARFWQSHDVAGHGEGYKRINHPQ